MLIVYQNPDSCTYSRLLQKHALYIKPIYVISLPGFPELCIFQGFV